MCGIAGYMGPRPLAPDRVTTCLGAMRNRGPDGQRARRFALGDRHVHLLHARLSILDLEARSDQPFTIGDTTLIFNGEIYNYLELKADLERRGIACHTKSDTEVLLQAYRTWGPACVDRLEGMWAFAVFDRASGRLFLSRDRFGEKPLYLMTTGDALYFGSEIKFLKALTGAPLPVNRDHLCRYLVNGYKSLYKTRETYFRGVTAVAPAHNLVLDPGHAPRETRYWQAEYRPAAMSFEEAAAGIRERLIASMRLRLRADVGIAACLSGGVDSAALASIAVKELGHDLKTVSIVDRDARYNEEDNIRATIRDLGCDHEIIRIPQTGAFDRLERLIAYHDQPIATASYYVHAFLSEAIAKSGRRVAISGTAADELVTGYFDHFNLHLREMRDHPAYPERLAEWRRHVAPIVRNPYLRNPDLYARDPNFRGHVYLNNDVFRSYLKLDFGEDFVEERYCGSLLRNRMLNELCHEATPVILNEDDLNSMRHSVENRSPYLDRALVEFAYTIPPEHLIRDGFAKAPLRAGLKGILNDQVRGDRHKKGFNAAFASLLDLDDPDVRHRLLSDGPIFEIVDRARIAQVFDMRDIPNSFSKFMFSYLNAKIFLEQNP